MDERELRHLIQRVKAGTMVHPDPQRFMNQLLTEEIASKGEQVVGAQPHTMEQRGVRPGPTRPPRAEMDPVRRAALFIKMNDPRHLVPRGLSGTLPPSLTTQGE